MLDFFPSTDFGKNRNMKNFYDPFLFAFMLKILHLFKIQK